MAAQQDPAETSPELRPLLIEGSEALRSGDNAAAEQSFQRALAIAPDSVQILNDLAISLAREGKHEAAIATYKKALKIAPGDAGTTAQRGLAYIR